MFAENVISVSKSNFVANDIAYITTYKLYSLKYKSEFNRESFKYWIYFCFENISLHGNNFYLKYKKYC